VGDGEERRRTPGHFGEPPREAPLGTLRRREKGREGPRRRYSKDFLSRFHRRFTLSYAEHDHALAARPPLSSSSATASTTCCPRPLTALRSPPPPRRPFILLFASFHPRTIKIALSFPPSLSPLLSGCARLLHHSSSASSIAHARTATATRPPLHIAEEEGLSLEEDSFL